MVSQDRHNQFEIELDDLTSWLRGTEDIIQDNRLRSGSSEIFLSKCKESGIRISDKEAFITRYWSMKTNKSRGRCGKSQRFYKINQGAIDETTKRRRWYSTLEASTTG